ncbi:hypothetical protein BJ684DRAFT_19988 [Piptocephalis cylindrospora]|uniref:Conserved oligomeric Golgi complex subunit 3 C-terminal domain-containing protein n=1 Tax=Piptocephalis cylindrospora TaxID=1907219 RepID=A0A4P9Y6P5_9FUNG|nr:hypothetical protein BJ684DRAFT_19988 [Piptocephalis cylindrospora]|eukprot:RKP13530.1 hypothetical protein BJ684DRAFT_19988 [Piptocephalis cylindrospora]
MFHTSQWFSNAARVSQALWRPTDHLYKAHATPSSQYGEFLQECVRQYARLRQRLGIPLINSHLSTLPQSSIVAFCQQVAAYLASLCLEERRIYGLFFFKDHSNILSDEILVPFLQPLAYALEPHLSPLSPSSSIFQQCLSAIRASLSEEPAASIALGDQVTSSDQHHPSPVQERTVGEAEVTEEQVKSEIEAGCSIQ